MTGGIIDRLVIAIGLDASGIQKGRDDTRAALSDMKADAEQAQAGLDALIAKQRTQRREAAAEESRLADRIESIRESSTEQTKERDEREMGQLGRLLDRKKAAHREESEQIADQITEQRKVVGEKQRGFRDVERGEKVQSERARKRVQATRDEGTAVTALTGKLVGLFAAFTAGEGVASFLKNTLFGAAAAGRLADNLGVDIEALGAWEGAVVRVGGAAKDADGAIASLVKTRELIKAGQLPGDQAKVLNSFGITAQDLEDPIATLSKLAAASERMTKPQFSLRLGMLGFDQNAINTLQKGEAGLKSLMDESRRAGVVTAEMSEKSQRLTQRWEDLKQKSSTLGRNILERLAPSLERILDKLIQLADWAQNNMPIVTGLVAGLGVALAGVAAISFVGLIGSLGGLAAAFGPVGIAVAGIVAGLGYIAKYRADKDATHEQANADPNIEFRKAELARARKELAEREKSDADGSWFRVRSASHGQSGQTMESAREEVRRQERLLALAMGAPRNGKRRSRQRVENPYDTVLGYGAYGSPERPLSTLTMGEAVDFGKKVLIPNSKAAGVGRDSRGLLGSSAMGAYQITQSTLSTYAKRLYGEGWKSVTFDGAAQDRIAEAVFNDTKHGNLKNTWESLPDTRPGAYANVPWSKMRDIIMQNEGTEATASPTKAPPRNVAAQLTPAQAQAALRKGEAQLARRIKDLPEAAKKIAREKFEANPHIVALRKAAGGVVARGNTVTMETVDVPARRPPAPPPPPPPPAAGASASRKSEPVPVTVAEPAPAAPTETPLGHAAGLLSQAASALLASANALQSGRGVRPAGFDPGLTQGARNSYASHMVSNDNSRRIEAQTHIGSINVSGGRDGASTARAFERTLRSRSLVFMADAGLQ